MLIAYLLKMPAADWRFQILLYSFNTQKQKPQTIKTRIGSLGFLLLQEYIFCRVLDIRVPQIMKIDIRTKEACVAQMGI